MHIEGDILGQGLFMFIGVILSLIPLYHNLNLLFIFYFCLQELGLKISDLNKPENKDLNPCDFDYKNQKSPCHFESCRNQEDEENTKCIRYILDYCLHYDDRGCVDQLPQLMNKLGSSQYKEIQQMQSDF